MDQNFLDLLKNLIRHPAVVGAEHTFFRILQRELEERGARVTWYQGLLVAQGDRPESAYLSAHIDRHGLICTGPGEFQYAAFVAANRSDLLGNSVSEKLISKVADRFLGAKLYGYQPWSGLYLGSGQIKNAFHCEKRNNLIFDVEGLDSLVAGTPVAFTDRLTFAEGCLSAQLDNVLTVAHLVYLFEQGYRGTAFFTAQEESGSSWRFLLEWFRRFAGKTNRLIVLDTSPYPEREAADAQSIVLRKRDANAEFDPGLTAEIADACERAEISYSYKDEFIAQRNQTAISEGREPASLGSTELGRIINGSNGEVQGTTLQIPTTGYHTMEESCTLTASDDFARLLKSVSAGP